MECTLPAELRAVPGSCWLQSIANIGYSLQAGIPESIGYFSSSDLPLNQLAESFWLHVLLCLAAALVMDTVTSPNPSGVKAREGKRAHRDGGTTIRWTIVAVLIPYVLLIILRWENRLGVKDDTYH
ncbi:hypothetical protein NKR19_g8257 [Coniochaeta hoffmannii]|uniref:Uncharacterized protein n=1 Tax=Coniochaeta hoffmannii TaxID=91930 RepID=A0AA38R7B2_9PEZI|nr:hypothetical protein NKR19_g8257 [Coniochaeta hoffmannii]